MFRLQAQFEAANLCRKGVIIRRYEPDSGHLFIPGVWEFADTTLASTIEKVLTRQQMTIEVYE